MYDFICNRKIIDKEIQKKTYLVVKENLFSLSDCIQISKGKMPERLKQICNKAFRHIRKCKVPLHLYFSSLLFPRNVHRRVQYVFYAIVNKRFFLLIFKISERMKKLEPFTIKNAIKSAIKFLNIKTKKQHEKVKV